MLESVDPYIIAIVAFSAGIWAPDKYTNDAVVSLAEAIVTGATGREPDEIADEMTNRSDDKEPEESR